MLLKIMCMKRKLLFGLALALMGVVNSVSADELTVYDGTTTNENVPLRPYYGDTSGQKSEFIIPASQLNAMTGGTITRMQFELSTASSKAWTSLLTFAAQSKVQLNLLFFKSNKANSPSSWL